MPKFRVTLKDPDGPADCIGDAARTSLPEGLSAEEREAIIGIRREELSRFAGQWLEYGEYAQIEFDTEAGTATLLKNGG